MRGLGRKIRLSDGSKRHTRSGIMNWVCSRPTEDSMASAIIPDSRTSSGVSGLNPLPANFGGGAIPSEGGGELVERRTPVRIVIVRRLLMFRKAKDGSELSDSGSGRRKY